MIRIIIVASIAFIAALAGVISSASAINYGAGTYGSCTYDTCSISLVSDANVAVNVTPTSSARCTVQSNSVTATTDSSTGYTVTVNNKDTSTTLNGPSANTIASTPGTPASPAALAANTWGYRVDSIAGFGAGPTSATTNTAIPSLQFAATPSSVASGGVIRTTSTTDGSSIATPVWYGVCADASKPTGTYTDEIVYTAVIN